MELKQVDAAIDNRTPVMYQGVGYLVNACILRRREGKRYYQLELLDKNNNSIVIADMEKVELA